MKYSYNWIQKHIKEKLPTPEELKEKIIFHAFEVESMEKIGDDTIFDIKVLPDRAGDCLSHFGMAREIAGLFNFKLKNVEFILPEMPLLLPIEVKTDLCKRFIAIRIDGIKVGPSPDWLREALEIIGQRSINNVVDATNFVLHDLGQPVHAYDASKIDGGIVVRAAHVGETIITLSEETKTLTQDMLVISDYVGALGIAGVKGGKTAEISDSTNSIILEIANFDSANIRKTARFLNLATDASKRFENNLSPVTAILGAAKLISIIKEIAGGEITGVKDFYPSGQTPREIKFSTTEITRVLGDWVTKDSIKEVFDKYHYNYSFENNAFTLVIPYWRNDINGIHDIAEEIGRAIGYDKFKSLPLPVVHKVEHSLIYQSIRAAKAWLVHDGYREVITYMFRKKGEVEISRGPKDKSALRSNLSDGLKESFDMNKLNAPVLGLSKIKLFEIGTVFLADKEEIHVATIDETGNIVETTLDSYITGHSIVVENVSLDFEKTTKNFSPWSVYPFITRDIAVWVPNNESVEVLTKIILEFGEKYCVRVPELFDQFEKDGKVSVAFHLVFQSFEKTLTENEVESWMQILVQKIKDEEMFEIR